MVEERKAGYRLGYRMRREIIRPRELARSNILDILTRSVAVALEPHSFLLSCRPRSPQRLFPLCWRFLHMLPHPPPVSRPSTLIYRARSILTPLPTNPMSNGGVKLCSLLSAQACNRRLGADSSSMQGGASWSSSKFQAQGNPSLSGPFSYVSPFRFCTEQKNN